MIEQLEANGMEVIEDVDKEAFREMTADIYDDFDQNLLIRYAPLNEVGYEKVG